MQTSNRTNMEVDEAARKDKSMTELAMECTRIDIKGASRGYLLWRSLKNIRKHVTRVSEPLTKGQRRALRRQLSFQVDDLERIILGVKSHKEEDSKDSEVTEDEEMKEEVEAIVKDAIDEASSTGKVVNVDYFENRMRQVEKECAELKKKMEEMSRMLRVPKRKKVEEVRGAFTVRKSPLKASRSGYGSDDHGYEGSLDLQLEQDRSKAKKERMPCDVCGKLEVLSGWRCQSCRNFWNRLIQKHSKGKLLPKCDHWVPTLVCKGCRRRKYETGMAIHCPDVPLGIPPCSPPKCPVDADLIKEESREIRIEYW